MLKKWQLKDVILLAFLSIFFGGVFVGSGYVYTPIIHPKSKNHPESLP
ncbi:cobalt ABC transporter permease [Streptococcus pneumoniae]|nr:cobalt ABC transporter permease [Streptococcus pneumoniae]